MTENEPARGFSVLLPTLGGSEARALISVAEGLADAGGHATILSLVVVPEDQSLSEGALLARKRRRLLRRLQLEWGGTRLQTSVRATRDIVDGLQEAVREDESDLLLLPWRGAFRTEERLARSALDALVLSPPCDLAVIKLRRGAQDDALREPDGKTLSWPPAAVLVPVRGGPHAALALRIGQRIADHYDASLTVMYIVSLGAGSEQRQRNDDFHRELLRDVTYGRTRHITVTAASVAEAIADEARCHQLVVLGAAARGRHRAPGGSHLFGAIPEAISDTVPCSVVIVKTAEPLTPMMFGAHEPPVATLTSKAASLSTMVDQWFTENTFHSHEFADLRALVRLKEQQRLTISLALPALNEERTIGKIIRVVKGRLMDQVPLIDELVVIDSESDDDTVNVAGQLGVPVFQHSAILPELGSYVGKGEALWKSLAVTRGDIVVWIDSDITDIHPKFIYGLVGPLLTQPRIGFVKGFYRRPLNLGGSLLTTGGGRVTELTARPLINLFYPQLSGLVQPLAGEMAGRRSVLEHLPFFTGYGVEAGLLIDILEQFGLHVIGQADLENRIHRNQSLLSLSKMAFAIVQVVMKRLEDRRHIELVDEINTSMKLIHYAPGELFLEVKEIREDERPAMITVPQYRHASPISEPSRPSENIRVAEHAPILPAD